MYLGSTAEGDEHVHRILTPQASGCNVSNLRFYIIGIEFGGSPARCLSHAPQQRTVQDPFGLHVPAIFSTPFQFA